MGEKEGLANCVVSWSEESGNSELLPAVTGGTTGGVRDGEEAVTGVPISGDGGEAAEPKGGVIGLMKGAGLDELKRPISPETSFSFI